MSADMENKITVTSPLLPDLDEFTALLKEIWDSKWITNNGAFHKRLEKELCEYLKVPYISLFTNGTLPLITSLQALRITGEVITTPYSFVATTHSLWWNGIKPVFVDIDPVTGNIDPDRIEGIADTYGLKVIYDAAHAFGVEVNGKSLLNAGDVSTLSFHATKVFNTIEGGALVMHDEEMKRRIDYLKNFGFKNEVEVMAPGINSKMDEVRAAYGLLNLRQVDKAIAARKRTAGIYRVALQDVEGVRCIQDSPGVRHNYSYFPIFIDAEKYGMTRDELYIKMKESNVLGRRYFYPLISEFTTYRGLPSTKPSNLPNAHKLANSVICLPMYHNLTDRDMERVIEIVRK